MMGLRFVMTSARWEIITKIFEAALEKPGSKRESFVHEECAGDLEMESEVVRLLAADEGAGSFLERPPMSTIPPQFPPGRKRSLFTSGNIICGRFEIVRFIGAGGMGEVYEALDLELKGKVALKSIRESIASDPRVLSRFRREVSLTRRITHPNVCRTFDIERHSSTADDGTNNDITFLTMELLEGETLANLVRRQGRLTAAEALPLVLQMIEALSAAHTVGIVHRDFKPSNVLLVPASACSNVTSKNAPRVVVTDFGLARAILPDGQISTEQAATSLTGSQGLMGTLVYMAPEQFERGEATVASDIYSLGLVMYEMVTGGRPFADPVPFAEAVKRIKQPAPTPKLLVPDLNPAWEAAICRCLEAQPAERFENVSQVAESITNVETSLSLSPPSHLRGIQQHDETLVSSGPPGEDSWRQWRVAIVVFVVVVSLSAVLFRHYQVTGTARLVGGATVLLTEIQNSTGDKRFDDMTELIRHQLSQSPYFNLLDAGRVRDVLTRMTKQPNSPLDPPTAREVALRSGAPRVIFGAVSRVGDSYVLDIDIEQPDNNPGRSRARWENHWTWDSGTSSASGKEIPSGLLGAVRDGSDWIRSEVGESANDIARVDTPPQDVTTDNWDALSEFTEAEKFKTANQPDDAIVALHNAVAADIHFALAYMRLGDLLVSLGRYREGYAAYQSALATEQQQRLTRRERDRLEGIYASDAEDFKTAEASFRDYTVYYPNDYLGWFYRAYPLMMLGRVEEAIASLKKAVAIDPARMFAPALIARLDLILGNFEDASQWIQHLRQTDHADDAELVEGQSDFLQEHYEKALDHFGTLRGSQDPVYRSYAFSLLARVYAELGQYQNAAQALDQGVAADMATGDVVHRADKQLDRAYIDFKLGQYHACLQGTKLALGLERSLQRSLAAGALLGRIASEASGVMKLQFTTELQAIEAQLPADDFKPLSDIVRARLRGEVLLAEEKWKPAMDDFKRADGLQSPVADREYLARASLAVARHTTNRAEASRLTEEGAGAYSVLALRPGQIWQWAMDYPPGYESDQAFSFVQAASRSGKVDERVQAVLTKYLKTRAHADNGLHDVEAAKKLMSSTMFTSLNSIN
jgi:serine/threonine protein kinase/predicted negative regulator of RcsB-dependent stress response